MVRHGARGGLNIAREEAEGGVAAGSQASEAEVEVAPEQRDRVVKRAEEAEEQVRERRAAEEARGPAGRLFGLTFQASICYMLAGKTAKGSGHVMLLSRVRMRICVCTCMHACIVISQSVHHSSHAANNVVRNNGLHNDSMDGIWSIDMRVL